MDLEEYLKLEEGEMQRYDFSAEYATKEYESATSIEKYIIYKTYTSDSAWIDRLERGKKFREDIRNDYSKKEGRKFINWIRDPDYTPQTEESLLREIHKKIWPELECTYSDTMTSVQYIMSGYYEREIETAEEKSERLKISKRQQCSIKYMIYLWAAEEREELKKRIRNAAERMSNNSQQKGLEEFLSAWHTLGNYCPVPSGFNCPRSNFGKHDFWDLTLMVIRKWYLTDDKILKERILREDLFHNDSKGDIDACIKWLEQCGDGSIGEKCWENFVEKLFFRDWVNDDYTVKPLWEGHGWDNALLPIDDWEGFFVEYNRRISARTEKLINRLSEISRK